MEKGRYLWYKIANDVKVKLSHVNSLSYHKWIPTVHKYDTYDTCFFCIKETLEKSGVSRSCMTWTRSHLAGKDCDSTFE